MTRKPTEAKYKLHKQFIRKVNKHEVRFKAHNWFVHLVYFQFKQIAQKRSTNLDLR